MEHSKKVSRQQVYTLLVQVGRKDGDGLPEAATGGALVAFSSGVDEAEAVRETVVILKSPTANTGALNRRIAELHPYTNPCIIALPVISDASAPDYLTWLAKQTRPHV